MAASTSACSAPAAGATNSKLCAGRRTPANALTSGCCTSIMVSLVRAAAEAGASVKPDSCPSPEVIKDGDCTLPHPSATMSRTLSLTPGTEFSCITTASSHSIAARACSKSSLCWPRCSTLPPGSSRSNADPASAPSCGAATFVPDVCRSWPFAESSELVHAALSTWITSKSTSSTTATLELPVSRAEGRHRCSTKPAHSSHTMPACQTESCHFRVMSIKAAAGVHFAIVPHPALKPQLQSPTREMAALMLTAAARGGLLPQRRPYSSIQLAGNQHLMLPQPLQHCWTPVQNASA